MPLIPVGPNNYQPSPYWSRNGLLHTAQMSNMMPYAGMTDNTNYQNPRRVATPPQRRYGGASPYARMSNALRVAAARRGQSYRPPAPEATGNQPPQSAVSGLAAQYQTQLDRANEANEQRYQDILQGYRDQQSEAMDLANLAADQRYRDASARAEQDLINRGLRNSTEMGNDYFDAFERSQQIPLQTLLNTTNERLRFMERRNDVGPDTGQLIALSQMQGQLDALRQSQQDQIQTAVQPAANTQQFATAPRSNYNYARPLPFVGAPIIQGSGYQIPNLMGMGLPQRGGYGGGGGRLPYGFPGSMGWGQPQQQQQQQAQRQWSPYQPGSRRARAVRDTQVGRFGTAVNNAFINTLFGQPQQPEEFDLEYWKALNQEAENYLLNYWQGVGDRAMDYTTRYWKAMDARDSQWARDRFMPHIPPLSPPTQNTNPEAPNYRTGTGPGHSVMPPGVWFNNMAPPGQGAGVIGTFHGTYGAPQGAVLPGSTISDAPPGGRRPYNSRTYSTTAQNPELPIRMPYRAR